MRIGRGVVAVAPRRGDHRVALRAAVSVAVPLLVLLWLGRLDLSVYACFGAFAALYGRFDGYADRLRMQAAAGGAVVAAMLLGTLLSLLDAPQIVCVIVVALLATACALIAYAWRWHPPGALFVVFAAGACASLPATPTSFVRVLGVGGGAVAFSVAITAALALGRVGRQIGTIQRVRLPADRDAGLAAGMVGLGALLAGLAGLLLIGDHWYWAMVAAVAALGGTHLHARVVRGLQRLTGTLLGVLIAAGLLALQLPAPAVIVIAVLLQAGAELFVGRNYGIAMVFITPLALLMIQLAVPADPAVLLRDRALDTVIGVVIGTAVAVVSAALRRRRSGAAV